MTSRMCLQSSMSIRLLCLAVLVAGVYSAAFGDSVEEGVRDKKIITLLRRNTKGHDPSSGQATTDSCKLYGHSCLGGHGKRSEDGSSGGGAVGPDVMQMLRKTSAADDEVGAAPFTPQARYDRVTLLEKALVQLLRNRMGV
ncbi:neuropeptide CCHamide-2 isoform X2 [Haemaphysalis longicornis]